MARYACKANLFHFIGLKESKSGLPVWFELGLERGAAESQFWRCFRVGRSQLSRSHLTLLSYLKANNRFLPPQKIERERGWFLQAVEKTGISQPSETRDLMVPEPWAKIWEVSAASSRKDETPRNVTGMKALLYSV